MLNKYGDLKAVNEMLSNNADNMDEMINSYKDQMKATNENYMNEGDKKINLEERLKIISDKFDEGIIDKMASSVLDKTSSKLNLDSLTAQQKSNVLGVMEEQVKKKMD